MWSVALPISRSGRTVSVDGANSSQRTTARPLAPATVCWVQTASTPPADGSRSCTAWVRRPSRLSSRYVEPGCGTLGGTLNDPTVMSPSATSVGPGAKCHTITFDCGAAVSSWAATMYPGVDPSALLAGTGVKASEPSVLCRRCVASAKYHADTGELHDVSPASGLGIAQMLAVTKGYVGTVSLDTLAPIVMKLASCPSLG